MANCTPQSEPDLPVRVTRRISRRLADHDRTDALQLSSGRRRRGTLKYRPGYPDKPFTLTAFVGGYNDDHQHSGIRFVTPSQRHAGHDAETLAHRAEVYRNARQRHPAAGVVDSKLEPIATVRLTPEHGINN